MELRRSLSGPQPQAGLGVRRLPRRGAALEILRGPPLPGLPRVCPERAMAAPARPACGEIRGARLATSALARHAPGCLPGLGDGLRVLLRFLAEAADGGAEPHSRRRCARSPAAIAHAALALPARHLHSAHYGEPALLHLGPVLPAWRLVLLPGAVRAEVAVGLSRLARAGTSRMADREAQGECAVAGVDSGVRGAALAGSVDFTGGDAERVPHEPGQHRHSPLQRSSDHPDPAVGPAAHATRAAPRLDTPDGARAASVDRGVGRELPVHGRTGVSLLPPVPRPAEPRPSGLHPGLQFQHRLEPVASRAQGIRAAARPHRPPGGRLRVHGPGGDSPQRALVELPDAPGCRPRTLGRGVLEHDSRRPQLLVASAQSARGAGGRRHVRGSPPDGHSARRQPGRSAVALPNAPVRRDARQP